MRTLLLPLILLLSITLSAQTPKRQPADTAKTTTKTQVAPEPKKETTVIICNGKSAKVYHKYQCKGLKSCKSGTSTVTLNKAKELGRRQCRICYE